MRVVVRQDVLMHVAPDAHAGETVPSMAVKEISMESPTPGIAS